MKTVSRLYLITMIITLLFNIHCKIKQKDVLSGKGDSSILRLPLILQINLKKNEIFSIKYNDLNWAKLEKDNPSYVLYNILIPNAKKTILIKKDFLPLQTGFEYSFREERNEVIILIHTYNYSSTHFVDSLLFAKQTDFLKLKKAYFISHSLGNENTYCSYLINKTDTINLQEALLDQQNCISDFQEDFILNTLRQADEYWTEQELDSARKYYSKYLILIKDNKVDTSLIPKYVFKRLAMHFRP